MEYARDIWLFLYRTNGINFADLMRMRWNSVQGGYLIFFRRKTQSTRKNNIKPIKVPITDKLQELIDKVGVKDSPFILGLLEEGFAENTYENLSHKIRSNINEKLMEISTKLNLSVPSEIKNGKGLLCYDIETGRGIKGQYRRDARSFQFCRHGTLSGQSGHRKDS